MQPLNSLILNVFIMNWKIHLRNSNLNEYFKPFCIFISVFIHSRALYRSSMNPLWSSLLFSLKFRSWFFPCLIFHGKVSSHCPIGHCFFRSLLLFASQILCDSPGNPPTYSGRVVWKPKMHNVFLGSEPPSCWISRAVYPPSRKIFQHAFRGMGVWIFSGITHYS